MNTTPWRHGSITKYLFTGDVGCDRCGKRASTMVELAQLPCTEDDQLASDPDREAQLRAQFDEIVRSLPVEDELAVDEFRSHIDLLEPVLLEHTQTMLYGHRSRECWGNVCSLHRRTEHRLREWPQSWRPDIYRMERLCPHGIGHPDPDDYYIRNGQDKGTHACDGCCCQEEPIFRDTPGS